LLYLPLFGGTQIPAVNIYAILFSALLIIRGLEVEVVSSAPSKLWPHRAVTFRGPTRSMMSDPRDPSVFNYTAARRIFDEEVAPIQRNSPFHDPLIRGSGYETSMRQGITVQYGKGRKRKV
jgi:hypothetical protein